MGRKYIKKGNVNVIFSEHSLKRLPERNIQEWEVIDCLLKGRIVYLGGRKYEYIDERVKVIVREDPRTEDIVIITVKENKEYLKAMRKRERQYMEREGIM